MGVLDFLASLFGEGSRSGIKTPEGGRSDVELWDAVDHAVTRTHPNVGRVRGYRKKLRQGVEKTLAYADILVDTIPGPIEFSADAWGRDPLVQAVFSGIDELTAFFRDNHKLNRFFNDTGLENGFALLSMTRKEKKVLGVRQEGRFLRRDVAQVAVEFLDHRIVAPGATENDTRKQLSMKALSLLTTHALEEILSLESWQEELEENIFILEAKLRVHEENRRQLNSLFTGKAGRESLTDETREVLSRLDKTLAGVKSELGSPEDYLRKVQSVLEHPEQYLWAERVELWLNDMGIRVDCGNASAGRRIDFAELHLKDSEKRAAVLIHYCRR